MLGDALLVAPVFTADGTVEYYVPEGTWTRLLDDGTPGHERTVTGPRWVTETHGYGTLPVLVRPGSVLPVGARTDRPDYAWADGVTLRCVGLEEGYDAVTTVPGGQGAPATFRVRREADAVIVASEDAPGRWTVQVGDRQVAATGTAEVRIEL
jgi:alpha-D-xyloside xylohydrolase